MNLSGKCDAVEATAEKDGVILPFLDERKFSLYPIEYKHGRFRSEPEYELQLCAQAICLEEMYSCKIERGALFFISSHRRKEILFDDLLRNKVSGTASSLSAMLDNKQVPQAESSAKCSRCSLKEICMPDAERNVVSYMRQLKKELGRDMQ
ncbi:MAG: CRISPR-associated protein Cas4 [Ruminococcus sp.]|nr:CRISPR-associated protein Cas4 [Ruminococcus sp.]